MKYKTLLGGVSANGSGTAVELPRRGQGQDEALVQVEITGTATVAIEGRLNDSLSWVSLTSVSANGLVPVAFVPHLRATVSGYSSGTVTAQVGYR